MSFWNKLLNTGKTPPPQQPAAQQAAPVQPPIAQWEKISEGIVRQNIALHGTLLVRVFDFDAEMLVTDGTGPAYARGGSKMPFSEVDAPILQLARDEMIKLGGSVVQHVPVKLSEEWHQLSASVIEQVSQHSSRNGVNTLRKVFDFAKQKVSSEIVDVSIPSSLPFSSEDHALVTQARDELGKFRAAVVSPFKNGVAHDIAAPQKASFRKKLRVGG